MATYSVVSADGQLYGPADEGTLAQWAAEGRINAQTVLYSHETGQRITAQSIPSLAPALAHPPRVNRQPAQPQLQYMPIGYASPRVSQFGNQLSSFPVAGTVALTYLTFGIFPWIHFGLMHDKMPKNRRDDPSAVKAILFGLIPFFNMYWHFFNYLRLMERVDEQRTMAGLQPAANKGFFITASVLMFIPILQYISALFLLPIVIGQCQSQVNGLVFATRR